MSGLKGLPMAGDELAVVASEQRARDVAAARMGRADAFRASRMAGALHAQVGGEGGRVMIEGRCRGQGGAGHFLPRSYAQVGIGCKNLSEHNSPMLALRSPLTGCHIPPHGDFASLN